MLIYVDIDGVCADLETAWLARYNRDYGDHLSPDQLDGWDVVSHVKPECGEKIYDYLEDPSLYDEVKPIPDACNGVETLRQLGHRVVFATASPNGSAGRKLRWLLEHGFLQPTTHGTSRPDYVEIRDKGLLMGDVLIDDGPHNVQDFRGFSILFEAGHNRNFDWHTRADRWSKVLAYLTDPDLRVGNHPTEVNCPVQARAFKELLGKMYKVHLEKNADYSPANILGTGELGVVVRLWDKIARLMNLYGFRLEVRLSHYVAPKAPKNESVDDSFMDASVYSLIGLLVRQGKWGH